jgi:lysophospholipase L1-like esterase
MAKLFFVGDSITAGAWDPKGGWAARIIGDLMSMNIDEKFEGFYCFPYNLGVSGDQIPDLLQRIEAEIDARIWKESGDDFAQIVLSIGVNDSIYLVDEDKPVFEEGKFSKNIATLLKLLKKLSVHLSVIGLLPVVENLVNPMPWAPNKAYRNERVKAFEDILQRNCQEQDVPFYPLFKRWSERADIEELFIDGVHPNEKGHKLMASEIKEFLLNDKFVKRHTT